MRDSSRQPGRATWFVAGAVALTVVLYVWPLTIDAPLVDPDEGLHAAIAQEMNARGDYVMPRFLGEPFLDKPILYFWALAGSIRLFGATELAVRLPGLIFGWLGALTTMLLAAEILGRRVGELAYACYATLILPLVLTQAAVHDVALIPWTNLALLFLWRADRATRTAATLAGATAAGVCVGLSILTKGLAGVALVGVPFAAALAIERRLSPRMIAAGVWTLVVGAALAAPWYWAMERLQPGYLRYFFLQRHVMGFATSTQLHGERPWFYYLPILAGGAWPWSVYAPFAWRVRTDETKGPGLRLTWTWLAVGALLLSVAGSKLVTYLLPIFPPVAILAAAAWREVERHPDQAPRGWGAAVWLHVLVGCLLLPLSPALVLLFFGIDMASAQWPVALGFVVAYGGVALLWQHRHVGGTLASSLTLVAAMFVVMMNVAAPGVAAQVSSRSLARYFNSQVTLPREIWIADERLGSVVFYMNQAHRQALTPRRIETVPLGFLLGRLANSEPDIAVVLADRDLPRVERGFGFDLEGVPFEQAGRHRVYTVGPLRERMLRMIGGDHR